MEITLAGAAVRRKDARSKVTGTAVYTDDGRTPQMLTAKIVTSTCAHGLIRHTDISRAAALKGVCAVLTGADATMLCGPLLADRPPLAQGKVRYFGEPVALVIAESDAAAAQAALLVEVEYEPIRPVFTPSEALRPGAPLLHETLGAYKKVVDEIYPEPGTNVCDRIRLIKGDAQKALLSCHTVIDAYYTHPPTDHAALETRAAQARIDGDGVIHITTSTQAPHEVQKEIASLFGVDMGKVQVTAPFVGGAFGGKAGVDLEILAVLASRAVGGRPVRLANTREEDIATSPVGIGAEVYVRLGADNTGKFKALEMRVLLDTGAYTDMGPRMARAILADCTGPYNIEHVFCECVTVYTNHTYATSLRGFGHITSTFCIERTVDKLAASLRRDPAALRNINLIRPGDTAPTNFTVTESTLGNPEACLEGLKKLIRWEEGPIRQEGKFVYAKGLAMIWKTSSSPPDAGSSAVLLFNDDGSVTLQVACVEIGPAMRTTAAQICAAALGMDVQNVHVTMAVSTDAAPRHWKTVASMTTFLLGRAILSAVEDAKEQLRRLAALSMRCASEDLDVSGGRVSRRSDPAQYVEIKSICRGYKFQNGNTVGGRVIGRGSVTMQNLTTLDRHTGHGRAGPYWTVGAQAVEVQYDTTDHSYRLLRAATVLDAGKIINPEAAHAVVRGGMAMGLSQAGREGLEFDPSGRILDSSLRSYKVMHFSQTPEYLTQFVETPNVEGPFGARGIGEHGAIGMPAALANALSLAARVSLDELPVTPEKIWLIRSEKPL
jgi:CO/xanthine dehydrogenase Mo-binding subunit